MLRVCNFNTAYWGRVRTAAEAYECDKKVNAIIGQSGSGKTTMMDALRIVLGDARFENNRAMDHYINPNSNWAVAMASFANGEEENYPFKASGYHEDTVSVCVRLSKNLGKCIRDYYIIGGNFEDILDLGSNPLHYKALKVDYNQYMKILKSAGMSEVFMRLMMMRPEEVQNIVDLQPYQLFDKVFQLKGQKHIQEVHDNTETKVKVLIEKERQTLEDLREAEQKLSEYEEKKIKYENLIKLKEEHKKLDLLLRKRKYYDNEILIKERSKEKDNCEIRLLDLLENKEDSISELYYLQKDIKILDTEVKKLGEKEEEENQKVIEKSESCAVLKSKVKEKDEEVVELQGIKEEPIDKIKEELKISGVSLDNVKYNIQEIENKKRDIKEKLNKIDKGVSPLPKYVEQYRGGLKQNNINGIMIGDCISVKEEFSDWLNAIEGLLGKEKFRIIVSKNDYLEAKKIQESYKYRARVSLPRKLTKEIRHNLINYRSIFDALDIEKFNDISGYLEKYSNVFLVDNVEEGDRLQKLGHKTLTKGGLLQDEDGSLFLGSDYLVCGKIARQKYKDNLINELNKLKVNVNKLYENKVNIENINEALKLRLENQERRLQLPNIIEECNKFKYKIKVTEEELMKEKEKHQIIKDLKIKADSSYTELRILFTELSQDLKNLENNMESTNSSILGYKGELTKLNNDKKKFIDLLLEVGLDENDIEFIEYEAESEKIFTKDSEHVYTEDYLSTKIDDIDENIFKLSIECKGITEGIIAMVEPQKKRVDILKEESYKATEDREEWEKKLEEAKLALKYHVRETMNEYIEEFKDMAELLDAKGVGKFEQDGDDYHNWKLIIKIGFDGKETKPYYDPDLSKGQRAAVSIMLLLAAINNKNEDSRNSIMFLDEPTSRVDDYRASEIGKVLQKTNIQFFITHQVSASLQSVDWINNSIILSKLKEGQEFADNPIVEYKGA